MNQKGVTLATVIVIIIVMLIIATVSLVAGNQLILKSKEYKEEQEIQSVKAAVLRKKAEVNMAGSLIPIGEAYVGNVNPIIKSDSSGNIVATGWYLLDEAALEKLGVYDVSSRFIVHYDYEVVLTTENPDYLEEYIVTEYLHELIDSKTVAGIALKNKTTSGDAEAKMVKNKEKNELFGTGWYLLKPADFPSEHVTYMNHSYLLNFETARYVKITDDFEGIDVELN